VRVCVCVCIPVSAGHGITTSLRAEVILAEICCPN